MVGWTRCAVLMGCGCVMGYHRTSEKAELCKDEINKFQTYLFVAKSVAGLVKVTGSRVAFRFK